MRDPRQHLIHIDGSGAPLTDRRFVWLRDHGQSRTSTASSAFRSRKAMLARLGNLFNFRKQIQFSMTTLAATHRSGAIGEQTENWALLQEKSRTKVAAHPLPDRRTRRQSIAISECL
ncbi:hypothetical protein GCM10023321_19270 [Pseudonocardia eucalypti]|uniref:Uncharacterized protein n=1 Tax=Pseudonocardia eucalypti TaxID=648755 RepID=A0ABP9PT47_9PSEU